MTNSNKNKLVFQPRSYQLHYLEKAKKQNVIICLGTGAGKTYISIMLLKEYTKQMKNDQMKAIFLCPTIPLVNQQAEEIKNHTSELFRTKKFCGRYLPNSWDLNKWRREIDSTDLLVITPDTFCNILTKQYIDIKKICVLIIDECHHAGLKRINSGSKNLTQTNHPYKRIMKFVAEKKMENEIRIIGLTASVVNACYDKINLSDCVKELELTYNSRIYGELNFDPKFLAEPNIQIWLFDEKVEISPEFDQLYSIQKELKTIINEEIKKDEKDYFDNMLNILKYEGESSSINTTCIEKMIRDLDSVHRELGVYPAYLVCLEFKKELENFKLSMNNLNSCFLISSTLRYFEFCELFYFNIIQKIEEDEKVPVFELITDKMTRLLDIIQLFRKTNSNLVALVFVDRVIYSYAISKYLQELSDLPFRAEFSFIRPNFFVGTNNDYMNFKFIKESVKNFKNVIKDFKCGLFNLLVTTAVLEEGIDIGNCNLVIRFNQAKNYREFVQSKGRARAKGSYFIMMHEDWGTSENQLEIFNDTEMFLNHCFKKSKEEEEQNKPIELDYDYVFKAEEQESFESLTGSKITLNESAAFLQRYICKKGNNSYVPTYSCKEIGEDESKLYTFTLSLVGVTPIKNEIVGKPYPDQKDAFKSACLEAIRQLYEMGKLDEHFIPISVEEVAQKCGLIERVYSEEELVELNFMFERKAKGKLMFKKQFSNLNHFKKLIKSTGYDLYEIIFHFKDQQSDADERRLALLTKLCLNEKLLTFEIQNYLSDATIELKLIEKDVSLNKDQLKKIDQFTLNVLKSAIPVFKKKKNLEFDAQKCLFKFSFIDQKDSTINYDLIDEFIDLTIGDERDLEENETKLIKAIYTDGIYKLINYKAVLPNELFYFKRSKKYLTFNRFYKTKFNITIQNQEQELIQVERIDNNKNDWTKLSKYYFPIELCVITSVSENLDRKLQYLPLLMFKIKQEIFLDEINSALNQEIISNKIENSIFNHSAKTNNNIIEYSNNPRFQSEQQDQDQSSKNSSSSDSSEEEEEEEIESSYSVQNETELNKTLDVIFKPKSLKEKGIKRIKKTQCKVHESIDQKYLNSSVKDCMNKTLKYLNYTNLDELLSNFVELFELISKNDLCVNYECSDDKDQIESNKKNQPIDSEELRNIDFNFWANESSNEFVICKDKLKEALTIKSATNELNLERLEFLGDIFLKFITCSLLFHHYPDSVVGELCLMKNQFVSNKNLYTISRRKQILGYMFPDEQFSPGFNWLPDGFRLTDPDPNKSDELVTLVDSNDNEVFKESKLNMVDRNQFVQLRPKAIADHIEALIGSVLVSSGIRNACLFMKYIGIYSHQFRLNLNSEQKNWFIEDTKKYDPLNNDPFGNLLAFTNEMYGKHNFKDLEVKIDYKFKNKALLVQAFKHASHNELTAFPSFENLEFLGDAVIDYLVCKYIFDDNVNYAPGELTDLKQSLINNNFFATISIKFGLDHYLISKCEILFNSISSYKQYFNRTYKDTDKLMIPNSSIILDEPEIINFDDTVEVPKILSDLFESLIGAIFIDSDFCLNTVWNVLLRFMSNELIKFKQSVPKSFLNLLNEFYPKAEFSKCFKSENGLKIVQIEINDEIFVGEGKKKKLAKMDAAKQVIKHHLKLNH